jgi:hypothetical protein
MEVYKVHPKFWHVVMAKPHDGLGLTDVNFNPYQILTSMGGSKTS